MSVPKMELLCEKCGKPQARDESISNENWNCFKLDVKCDCGGEFVIHIDGGRV